MLERALAFFRNPWVAFSLLGLIASALLVALTRLLGASWLESVIAVLAIALGVVVWVMVRLYFQERRSDRIEAGLDDARDRALRQADAERRGGRAWLEQSFADAVEQLRRSRLGADALYELPWLLVIGATGEGKSSAIAQSGLAFADRARQTQGAAAAARAAEFWLANEAVVLDSAGRFLDRDSEELRLEWEALLGLMREHRSALPVNGVVVCLSVPTLLGLNESGLDERARLLRRRLNQIKEVLGVDAPIYLLATKADRLEGLAEIAGALGAASQEPLGWTNPERRFADAGECVREGLLGLCAQLDRYSARLVLAAGQPALQRRLFLFPDELASAAERLARFAQRAFAPAIYDETPFLRGVYFASALRDGQTLSPLLERLGASWARTRSAASGESSFLRGLFGEVLLGDAELALPASRLGPRERRFVLGLAGVATAGVLGLLGISTWFNVSGVQRLAAAADAAIQSPDLQELERLRVSIEQVEAEDTFLADMGIGQLDRALERARVTYVGAFRRELEEDTKNRLLAAVREFGDEGFEALVDLSLDLVWLSARADPDNATPPALARFAPVAVDDEAFARAYAAFVRWAPGPELEARIEREKEALNENSARLFNLGQLARWSEKNADRYPPVRYADFGLPTSSNAVDSAIPAAYTLRGWEGLVRNLLASVSRTGSVTDRELEAFRTGYVRKFDESWQLFLLGIDTSSARSEARVTDSPYLRALQEIDRNTRIEDLPRGAVPPWLLALRETLRTEALPPVASDDTDDGDTKKEETPPWQAYLELLGQVQADVADAQLDGERALKVALDATGPTPTGFALALGKVPALVPPGQDPRARDKLIRILSMPILNGFSAVLDGATSAVDRRWNEEIASRFGAETDEAALNELYLLGTGRLDRFRRALGPYYAAGVAEPVLGRNMGFGREFLAWMRSAEVVQKALFPDGSALSIEVTLAGVPSTLRRSNGLFVTKREIRMPCGAQRLAPFTLRGEGSTSHTFTWTPRCTEVSLHVYARPAAGGEDFELQPTQRWTGPLAFPRFLQEASRSGWRFEYEGRIGLTAPYELRSGAAILNVVHRPPPRSVRE